MIINGYQVLQIQPGDLVLGYRPGGLVKTYMFSGVYDGAGGYQQVEYTLTQSDIENLGGGFELLPSQPVAGDYYDVQYIRFEFTSGTSAYTITENLYIVGVINAAISQNFLEYSTPNTQVFSIVRDSLEGGVHGFSVTSQGLSINTGGLPPTGGNGTLRVIVNYRVLTFGE